MRINSYRLSCTWPMRQLAGRLLVTAFVLAAVSCGGPSSYDDCILQYSKAGMDRAAVASVRSACRAKFAEPRRTSSAAAPALAKEQVALLNGRGGPLPGTTSTTRFLGTLYNGNDNVNVMEVEFLVVTTIGRNRIENTYRENVFAARKSTGGFAFDILPGDEGAEYSWSISRAWGWPVE